MRIPISNHLLLMATLCSIQKCLPFPGLHQWLCRASLVSATVRRNGPWCFKGLKGLVPGTSMARKPKHEGFL